MTETIVCALITGGLTLMGVLIANGKQQAITDTKLDELTREVREHNSFAQRVPVIEEQLKVANHRIAKGQGRGVPPPPLQSPPAAVLRAGGKQ